VTELHSIDVALRLWPRTRHDGVVTLGAGHGGFLFRGVGYQFAAVTVMATRPAGTLGPNWW